MLTRYENNDSRDKFMLISLAIIILMVILGFHVIKTSTYQYEKEALEKERDVQILKADSILAAKLQSDKEIMKLRILLLNYKNERDSLLKECDMPIQPHKVRHRAVQR